MPCTSEFFLLVNLIPETTRVEPLVELQPKGRFLSLACKYWINEEVTGSDKHSSIRKDIQFEEHHS
jgi:hypothetical protein